MYWNHSNQTICSAYAANKFMLVQRGYMIEAHMVITMEMSSVFPSSQENFPKSAVVKRWVGEIRRC